ncbi:hypothetical protein BC939DRAFT_444323 [Gamsiella multidivaricata]|uniref:uncharacterized protein n=1 Tax=Gamsiella multidivaricata TaxID=101098 RepID=UPI00221FFDA5|nr:uncharacterized protein BC939DRAFT_444323 [Gamsiella multidivaricata]KAG0355583.1 hypothetical protein BGZ54_001102 [Gamsiella multidivaricata]KAI7828019.1 hypothetical protein BC939DRAFT_444323 [Gamsiella multidivaricata]
MGLSASKNSSEGRRLSHSSDTRNEGQPLLATYHGHAQGGAPRSFPTAPVTPLLKEARYAIINALDTSLTRDELGSPEIYLTLLLPIVRKYREERRETAAVYCFLLNRWQFLKDAESDLANARLSETRAHACEIVATKVLKAFSMRQLIDVLTYDFSPMRRKESRLYLPHFEGDPSTEPMSALEVAISARAKRFLSNPLVQEIINQIWLGEIVFFSNAIDNPQSCLNASQQEIRTVTVYDSRDIKFLRLSRLRVPRYKTTFQMASFSAFIFVYTLVTFAKETEFTVMELIMDIFALSFTLDEFFQLKDSGPSFYFETVWNLFDVPIYIIFLVFMSLRISTFFTGSIEMSNFAYDFLACNAILLWPRLFAALDHYRFFGTMLVVLRQMLIDSMLFLALSFIFYVGFLQAFYGLHDNKKSYGEIAWLLLQVFFGSAFLGFEEAAELSELFGAPLMVLFVAISVLMLYTLLISIFSQTFSEVSANAKEEFMFLFSVKVMEEVKSDALYEFQPPFNILAGIAVWPCSLIYPPETVGKVSRVLLRVFYFPELVFIWLFETLALRKKPQYMPVQPGMVNHQGIYGTMPYASVAGSVDGGGVAKRRQEETDSSNNNNNNNNNNNIKASTVEATREDALSPMELEGLATDPFQSAGGRAPASSSLSQQLNQINTGGLSSTNTHEVLSPYFENIRRFRDSSNANSASAATPSLRDDIEGHQERTQYSYYPSAPIGMGIGISRQGSMNRGRVRHGTEATLAGTFQGIWPSYHDSMTGGVGDFAGGGDASATIGGNCMGDTYYQHHFQLQEQLLQQHQHWCMDAEQKRQEDGQELTRLMESRYAEMRIRMEQIESKLDRLMDVIAAGHRDTQ